MILVLHLFIIYISDSPTFNNPVDKTSFSDETEIFLENGYWQIVENILN